MGHDEVVSLQELYGTLHKWKHVVKLPLAKTILRCLGRPFKNPIILYDDCRLALDIFALIRSNFMPQDAKVIKIDAARLLTDKTGKFGPSHLGCRSVGSTLR